VLLRLPWLNSRRRLLVALAMESLLFALFYLAFFLRRFGVWPGMNLPLGGLLGFWLIASYVIGRYYDAQEIRAAAPLKQAIRTLITLTLSISVFLVWLWLTASPALAETSRGFMLPMLLLFAISSGLLQQGLNRLLEGRFSGQELWLVLGQAGFKRLLHQELGWSRQEARLQPVDLSHVAWPDPGQGGPTGLVVESFEELTPEQVQTLLQLQTCGLTVLSPVGWCEQVLQRFPPGLVSSQDLLRGQFMAPQGSIHKRLKRFGDVLMSGALLSSTALLLLTAALLIKVEDGGPVFYGQWRSGLDGEPFKVWKLRSMRVDAEKAGAQWSGRGDQRITRIGRVLRVTRIDELPQLWAVLTGTMSLIGPRPERPEIEEELERQIPHYRLRHLIRPGLSGWAQVNYPYGACLEDSVNKLSYDLYYIRNSSFWLDLLILFKTMRLVFNARGAVAQTKHPPRRAVRSS
jgi:exopolysaccharide biosynthesis polyprenyl glycosylphosphotransferase